MKFINKYFEPYTQYTVWTTFTEEDLKAVLEKELLSCRKLFSVWKVMINEGNIAFFKSRTPWIIFPVLYGQNSLRGVINIKCEKSEYSSGTILNITVAPRDNKIFVWIVSGYLLLLMIFLAYAGVFRQALWLFMLLPAAVCGFMLGGLAMTRSSAEKEIPKIRQRFELWLREMEMKYHAE